MLTEIYRLTQRHIIQRRWSTKVCVELSTGDKVNVASAQWKDEWLSASFLPLAARQAEDSDYAEGRFSAVSYSAAFQNKIGQ